MVRRPLLYGTVFFVLPVILKDLEGLAAPWILCAGLALLYRRYRNQTTAVKILLLALIFCLTGTINVMIHDLIPDPLEDRVGETMSLNGHVLNVQHKERQDGSEQWNMTIRTKEPRSRILVQIYDCDAPPKPGDLVEFSGNIQKPAGRMNPNGFDYRKYLRSQNIHILCSGARIRILREGTGVRTALYDLRSNWLQQVERRTDSQTASLIGGILFGDKGRIDEDLLTEFQKNGTAHILAVSGLHVGILYAFVTKLWPGRRKKLFFCFIVFFLWCYCILASMSASVVRASLMITLHTFGKLTDRRYDLSSAAFLVILLLLLKNPDTLFDPGFQMSFLAVLSMSLILPYVRRLHDGVLSGSLAAQAGLLPYTMYTFNYMPLGAFLVNLPVIAIAGILVPCGFVSMCASVLALDLFPVEELVLQPCCRILTGLNSMTCIEGFTTYLCRSPSRFFLALFYTGLLVFATESGRLLRYRFSKRMLLLGVLLVVGSSGLFWGMTRTGFERADLTFVSVGQGDCLHVRTKDHKNYLFDGGGSENYRVGDKTLRPYLLKNGVRFIDGAIVTHLHTDHYLGIVELCRAGMVKDLYVYDGNKVDEGRILQETGLAKEHLHYLSKGMGLVLGPDTSAEVLWPAKRSIREYEKIIRDEEEENAISLVMKIQAGHVSVLMTGDIDESCEQKLIKTCRSRLSTDILKVAHHGSKYSSSAAFLQLAAPQIAVIQVGKNNYGHPAPETLARLEEASCTVYRNDLQGAIGICLKKGRIKSIRTVRGWGQVF